MQQGKIHISDFADTNPFPGLQAVAPNSKLPVVLTAFLWSILVSFISLVSLLSFSLSSLSSLSPGDI